MSYLGLLYTGFLAFILFGGTQTYLALYGLRCCFSVLNTFKGFGQITSFSIHKMNNCGREPLLAGRV